MVQSIIPGCEDNPDPKDVIDVTPDNNENSKMNNAFDTLLVSAANAADRGRKLDEISQEQSLKIKKMFDENEKLRDECEQLVRRNHELYDEVTRLRNQPALAELNEFKKELEDRFEDASIGKLRQVCGEYDAWAGALSDIGESITDADFIEEFPEKWNELNNSGVATLRSVLGTIGFNVSVVAKGWRMSASCGKEMLVKLVDNPLLDNNIAKLDCEASPDITNGSLCLSDIRIVIYV